MQAEFSVELGADDPVLEMPWSDGAARFVDLRRHPELISQIPEGVANPPLQDFLLGVNSRSPFYTAKCDAWFSRELNPEEEIFGTCKFGGYVDLVLASDEGTAGHQRSFEKYERLLKNLVRALADMPEIPASVELILRRSYFHSGSSTDDGFYITTYVFGYGADETEARRCWSDALNSVEAVLTR